MSRKIIDCKNEQKKSEDEEKPLLENSTTAESGASSQKDQSKKKNTNQKNQETEHLWISKQRGETGRRNAANDGEDDRFRPEKRKKN